MKRIALHPGMAALSAAYALVCIIASGISLAEDSGTMPDPLRDAKVGEWIEYDVTGVFNANVPVRERVEIISIDETAPGKKFEIKSTMIAFPPGGMQQVMEEKVKKLGAISFMENGNFHDWCPDLVSGILKRLATDEGIERKASQEEATVKGKTYKANVMSIGKKIGEMDFVYVKFYVAPELPGAGIFRIDIASPSKNVTLTEMVNYSFGK